MLNPEHFIVTFARTVKLFRSRPDDVTDQKAALRALVALCQLGPAHLVFDRDHLWVMDKSVPMSLPSVPALAVQLVGHRVRDIRIAQNAAPADLLHLIRALARDPGSGSPNPAGSTVAVETEAPEPAPDEAPTASPEPPAPADVSDGEFLGDQSFFQDLQTGTEDTASDEMTLEQAADDLQADPYGGDVLARMARLANLIGVELERDHLELAVAVTAQVVSLEANAPEGSAQRAYGIALRRVLTRPHLERAVEMAMDARHADHVTQIFARAGVDGAEVLIARLGAAEAAPQCRAYLRVMRHVKEGAHRLMPLLAHREWYVAQGVATLLGEMVVEDAVPELAAALENDDRRVRQAAAAALARIGTREAFEHVRQVLTSNDDDLKSAVAHAVGGRRSAPLAMPLSMVAEGDGVTSEVRLECYRALGRIGTPDALQVLIKAVQPGGRLLGRKPTERRVAAIEGLKTANTTAARNTLEGLMGDRDRAVRTAAEEALAEMAVQHPA